MGSEEEARNLAAYYSGPTREREMSVMVLALSDVVAGTTGFKREREEDVNEIQPSVRPRATAPLSLPPAQIPMTAPLTAAMMPPPPSFVGFLMIMIVVENILKNFPQSGYQIVAALAILFLTFNIDVVVKAEMHNMDQTEKALGCTSVNISLFVSLISIWNFLALVIAGCLSEFLMQTHKFPRPLMSTMELLIACVEHVFTSFALPGSLYVASIVIGLSFGAQWPKSLRSCLVRGLHFTSRKWRERENKGEEQNKALKHLPCCGYIDVKEASLLARIVAKRRLFVVFICFLIMSPAEGTFMPRIYPKRQSAQTISDSDINQYVPAVHSGRGASEIVAHSSHTDVDVSNVEKYDEVGGGKHDSTQRTAATMEVMVPKPRKLLEPGKPQIDRGRGAQHN